MNKMKTEDNFRKNKMKTEDNFVEQGIKTEDKWFMHKLSLF